MRTAFLLLLLLTASLAPAQEQRRHVVMISIDGLMPAHYTRAGELGLRIPNLRRLMADGVHATGVIGVLPSVTYPSHTTLVTGVMPRQHGIGSNKIFDPLGTSGGSWNWYADAIEVPTLISAAEARWMTTASVSWPVSVGLGSDYNVPEFWRPGSNHEIDRKLLAALSTPGLLRTIETNAGRPLPAPANMTDDDRAGAAAFIIRTYRPEVMLLHLSDLDGAEHDHGPMTRQALEAVEKSDQMVGNVLDAIRSAGITDRTLVAIVSDHGFLAIQTTVKPNTLLRAHGFIDVDDKGKVKAWRAFFHSDGGSSALHLKDPADLDRVRSLLRRRMGAGHSGLQAILEADDTRRLGSRAELVLDAAEGYSFSDSVEGEWFSPATSKGTHGHAPDRPPLHASLILAGPFSRRGSLGIVPMTSIAPTLAQYLGLTLTSTTSEPISLSLATREGIAER